MKDIDKIIIENRQDFDDSEPESGHLERFRQKIHYSKPKKQSVFFSVLKIASVVILLVLSSLWIYDRFADAGDKNEISDSNTMKSIPEEYDEARFFYASQVDKQVDIINQIDFSGQDKEKQMLMSELADMDSVFVNLQQELNANPDDERILNAIITHYQLKIKVLNNIIDKLNKVKQTNSISYENTNI